MILIKSKTCFNNTSKFVKYLNFYHYLYIITRFLLIICSFRALFLNILFYVDWCQKDIVTLFELKFKIYIGGIYLVKT